ncbi:MAG: hypothetical protein INR65_17300 [Gluconacetobacter diazotrophicus]|nr:hypothetical protein [Gluconacetobacter diazotrophicus]
MPAEDADATLARITAVIRSFDGTAMAYVGPVTPDTHISRDLRYDSLSVMDFVMAIETEFDTVIPIDGSTRIETVGELAALLRGQQNGEGERRPSAAEGTAS